MGKRKDWMEIERELREKKPQKNPDGSITFTVLLQYDKGSRMVTIVANDYAHLDQILKDEYRVGCGEVGMRMIIA